MRQFSPDLTAGGRPGARARAAIVPELRVVTAASAVATFDDDLNGILFERAGGVVLTLPEYDTDPTLEPGYELPLWNIGAGAVTVAKQGADVLLSADSLVDVEQYKAAVAKLVLQDAVTKVRTWLLVGSLA